MTRPSSAASRVITATPRPSSASRKVAARGCAAILWKDAAQAPLAAEYLRLTAPDLIRLGVVDQIVPEPAAGAHEEHDEAARLLDAALRQSLEGTAKLTWDERRAQRYKRLRVVGGQ